MGLRHRKSKLRHFRELPTFFLRSNSSQFGKSKGYPDQTQESPISPFASVCPTPVYPSQGHEFPLLQLPTELLLIVISHLPLYRDILYLGLASKRLHVLLRSELLRRAVGDEVFVARPPTGFELAEVWERYTTHPLLHWYAVSGNLWAVRKILGYPITQKYLHPRDSFSSSALSLASIYGHSEIVRALLDAGAQTEPDTRLSDIEAQSSCSWVLSQELALHHAVDRSHMTTVRTLLEAGANINRKGPIRCRYAVRLQFNGLAPLHIAIANRDAEMVRFLLENGADANMFIEGHISCYCKWCGAFSMKGSSAIQLAAKTGSFAVSRTLLEFGASLESSETTYTHHPIFLAAAATTTDHAGVDYKERLDLLRLLFVWVPGTCPFINTDRMSELGKAIQYLKGALEQSQLTIRNPCNCWVGVAFNRYNCGHPARPFSPNKENVVKIRTVLRFLMQLRHEKYEMSGHSGNGWWDALVES